MRWTWRSRIYDTLGIIFRPAPLWLALLITKYLPDRGQLEFSRAYLNLPTRGLP